MELSETAKSLLIMIPLLLGAIALNIYVKVRRMQKTPLGRVAILLRDLHQNEKLMETFSFHWQSKKFRAKNWEKNRAKVDFLPRELLNILSKTFSIAEDFNQKIETAKKYKSDGYVASIELDKLKSPLAKCKQELEVWLQENMQNPAYYPKRRGLFGGLFR